MNCKTLLAGLMLAVTSAFTACAQADTPKVKITSELAAPVVLEKSQDKNYLKISLTGFPLDIAKRSPINLALVIDRSGSMGGDRIKKATEAAVMAVNALTEQDTLSVVIYDDTVDVIIPPTHVKDKKALAATIREKITARGGTALFAGVSRGIKEVSRHLDKEQVNRIILLSDGQANVGPSSTRELSELAKLAAAKGIAITTMGVGEGYNEDLMAAIAQYSDGNHVFIQDSSNMEKAFAHEFKDVMSVVAQDVVVEIKTADNVKPLRLLGREGDISGNIVTVKLNQLYARQEKYVLLELQPASGKANENKALATVNVRYYNLATRQQDRWDNKLTVRYTRSPEEVKTSQVDDVIVESAIQKSAIENERALKLVDEGKMDEAKAILQRNYSALDTLPVNAPAAQSKAKASAKQNLEQMQILETESKEVSRKSMVEKTYNIKSQKAKPQE